MILTTTKNICRNSRFFRKEHIMKATWKDKTIAESNKTIEVEGNQYFPVEDVDKSVLKPSKHHTTCPWKGEASYYHLEVEGSINENAAWYYPEPKDAASEIKNHIAFWKGVDVSE